ncbi:MAG TPA: AraC family transcriptional regulator [Puia sp.]|nr:AraC family transcriptional regulator [Puia sp.]
METKQNISLDKGHIESTIWEFDSIRMGHAITKYQEYTNWASPGSDRDVVRLHFGLKGNYSFTYRQLDKTFHLIGGHHNIMYSKEFNMIVENRTLEVETFGVQFPRELFIQFTQNGDDVLKRFAEQVEKGNNVMLTEEWGAVDTRIQQVIQQIIHCNYSDHLKKLFLLSKSIELLVLSAESCAAAHKKETFIKSRADKEKLIAVRDLINQRLHSPPNLSEIARTVGLNEYKLKKGFKETFNNTVFGYLTEQRLQLALQYLRDTEKTAAEISYELGYATPQHFNNAFKKKFGFTPYSVRNIR